MKQILTTFTAIALTSPLYAAEILPANGVWSGTSASEVHQINENHMVLRSNSAYLSFDPASEVSAMVGMSGTCYGAVEMAPPMANGTGHCVFSRDDGDAMFSHWTITALTADGAATGTWSVLGGRGTLEGASGGGSFASKTDPETGVFQNTVTGAVVIP
ncbi:hypothetical protein AB0T83_04885 [Fluviibacterium sp. DFM31]|uniref:Avidin family protein n=1 Tax=Meridianimarinicoccus marinus TaxID=3231483 RepID=A0ABV3L3M4_9RHOB